MEIGRVNRDRSGRVPRASSRTGAFYDPINRWTTPGDVQPYEYDFDPSEAVQHYDNPRTEDIARGNGY